MAWAYCFQNLDLGQKSVIIHLADGKYGVGSGDLMAWGDLPGATDEANFQIRGNAEDISKVVLFGNGLEAVDHAMFALYDLTLEEPEGQGGTTFSVGALWHGMIDLHNVAFGPSNVYHISTSYGGIVSAFPEFPGTKDAKTGAIPNRNAYSYSIVGGADRHLDASDGGIITFPIRYPVEVKNNPKFNIFAHASAGGIIDAIGKDISHPIFPNISMSDIHQLAYKVETNGIIDTGGFGLFPGIPLKGGDKEDGGVYR